MGYLKTKNSDEEEEKKKSSSDQKENPKQKTPGNMQQQVEQGKAPKSVDRVDKDRGDYEKDHVHFHDGSALNRDGTWKHNAKDLTKPEVDWIKKNGWQPPRNSA